jgi:hypothetical protein
MVILTALAIVAAAGACGGGDGDTADLCVGSDGACVGDVADAIDISDVAADTPVDAEPDGVRDVAGDVPADSVSDVVGDGVQDPGADATVDALLELPALPTQAPLAVPVDPLKDSVVASCAVYLEEKCEAGSLRRCEIYDASAKTFVDAPDPLEKRAYLFDRWRDLYQSPDGQAIDRDFNSAIAPGTPEAEWSAFEKLGGYWGTGDGGIWTGWSVVASVLRYSQTGTEADYLRMEQHVKDILAMYEVTGIPGYFTRYHFLLMPDDAPVSPDNIIRWERNADLNHHKRDIDPAALKYLPAAYTDGYTDKDGKVWKGRPMWHGRPSIDQNSGPMTSLPMAYDLLRDQELKGRISKHLTCYLKRLQRVELINLQQNPQLLAALMSYFAAGELKMDPGDIDLTKLDRIVGYVQRQINTSNDATFDKSCPETVQMEPWRVIDAADSQNFIGDLLQFVMDMDTSAGEENQIDHYYFPSLRGGDAMHLMHLATMAYHFTGDDQYRRFLYDELIGNIRADEVAMTAGAFDLPKYCKSFFGNQITYGPWWAFLHLLGDSPLKTTMQRGFHEEMWSKLVKPDKNMDFEIMYAGAVPPAIATDHDAALAEGLSLMQRMGGNGWKDGVLVLDDPRRAYPLDRQFVVDNALGGSVPTCPIQDEIDACLAEIDFMGVKLPGPGMDEFACVADDPWQCSIGNGKCVWKQMTVSLPPDLRPWSDFLWQRNPYAIGAFPGLLGGSQYAGSDVSEPYWNARRYGFVTAGKNDVLAWRPTAVDCGE